MNEKIDLLIQKWRNELKKCGADQLTLLKIHMMPNYVGSFEVSLILTFIDDLEKLKT